MEAVLFDWVNLLVRWAHMIVGIGWIGTSFYFIWLDLSLRRRQGLEEGIGGESWIVHGGGFYLVQKYLVAPKDLPDELHWFKYEAYLTWVSGFLLLAIVYYWGAESFLIDRAKADLSPALAIGISVASLIFGWLVYDLLCRSLVGQRANFLSTAVFLLAIGMAYGFAQVFSGRAAFIHVGAVLGTIMSANVFFIIIPNQKKTTRALIAGEVPAPEWGEQAKQRSTHNNYLTLPVLVMMVSNHYPMTFGHPYSWAIVAGIFVLGGLIRHFYNNYDAGARGLAVAWQWPAAALLTLGLIAFTVRPPGIETAASEEDVIGASEAFAIVLTRCNTCHSATPSDEDIDKAPGGVIFDDPEQLRPHAARILAQVTLSRAMPLGNKTGMTDKERQRLGRWIRAGMPED